MLTTVFADTTVALHVSYAIRATQACAPTSMRHMLLMLMESAEMMNRRQTDWLERLIGQRSSLVDFGGLDSIEIRAQAIMITQAVEQRLPAPELYAMLARFAQTEPEKSAGVMGVVEYVCPASPTDNRDALTDLVWRRYLPRRYRGGYSFRDIARRTHVSKSTLARTADWLDDECDGLELRALRHLEETFVPHGVCAAVPMHV
jgi:hypothetical protein